MAQDTATVVNSDGSRRQRRTYAQCVRSAILDCGFRCMEFDPATLARFDAMRTRREAGHAAQRLTYHTERLLVAPALHDVTTHAFDLTCGTPSSSKSFAFARLLDGVAAPEIRARL